MRSLRFPAFLAVALCAGCADTSGMQQSASCPSSVTASAVAPVSCGPNGWPNGGVVTNRDGNGPRVELWGPPTTAPSDHE
jgi:hypothetical protein